MCLLRIQVETNIVCTPSSTLRENKLRNGKGLCQGERAYLGFPESLLFFIRTGNVRAEKDDELSSALPEVSPVVFKWTVGASSSS